ncbi:cytochrome P450 [Streptomyces sp. NPDC055107]
MSDDRAGPYPTRRTTPWDPPPEFDELRERAPITRMRYPDGHLGWVVTGYELARAVLADHRFSARSEFKRAPVGRPGTDPFYGAEAMPGWLVDMDRPQHTRLRRVLAGHFTDRRVRAELSARVTEIVAGHLDAMAAAGPPTDLVPHFSLPVPSLVICELLGVPVSSRAEFQHRSEVLFSLDSTAEQATAAMTELDSFLRELVAAKKGAPGIDVLSRMVNTSDLGPAEIAGTGVLLLTAGHETTANSLSLATLTLLCTPGQRMAMPDRVEDMGKPVDELLRYLTVFHFGVPRTPLEDVELVGRRIRAGESITVALPAANRDPARFHAPNTLDLHRAEGQHLAFGHGIHQCVGQHLARLEMKIGLHGLFQRFPGLALACSPREVPVSADMGIYGVHALPVTW